MILGLDISSNHTGWAVMSDKLEDYGVIHSTGEDVEKLVDFYCKLAELINIFPNIKIVGVEDVYMQNVKTIKVLSRYHGVALVLIGLKYKIFSLLDHAKAEELMIRRAKPKNRVMVPQKFIYTMTPTEVFKILGIYCPTNREQKKAESVDWVNKTFGLSLKDDDIADAIMVAAATKKIAERLV